ncbi:uncharacterized protein PITG_06089 [Phytophthora infestans T30-4]|uniref:Uncharacterized protein n=2 Tax=Phytophthora infestans TaxID=4787 RepID=D0N6D4_PHYIT|nr:uncharacterized protein PITG_06089 [Phytophthora infestans T30-4]EEY70625.1 conserved hypothetical protein [Phytophthora infestans T30-4]KAF4131122.1 hypothetical protein GN958_ATG19667 [Phytophthora infestans]KAI9988725.1 hypothetical protein PInf_022187 [Phytophthora infestans]|eukprot:XP_002998279.1 conserved hypothetical protein [Phytophthora infestans T30-4]
MDLFQVSTAKSTIKVKCQPQNVLMVVSNRQLQVWNGSTCWPSNLQDGSLMYLVTDPGKTVEDESPASSASGSTSPVPKEPEKKKRAYKKCKATHTIRKEQKAVLEKKIAELQAHLEDIKFWALVEQGEVCKSYHDRVEKQKNRFRISIW